MISKLCNATERVMQCYSFSYKHTILQVKIMFIWLFIHMHELSNPVPSVETHYSSIYNSVCFSSHTHSCVFTFPISNPAFFTASESTELQVRKTLLTEKKEKKCVLCLWISDMFTLTSVLVKAFIICEHQHVLMRGFP